MGNDLISRSALKKYVNDNSTHWLNEWDTAGVLLAIEKAQAVDAVEVVRCNDCKYCFFDLSGMDYHLCMRHGFTARHRVQSDDFCSYGERRADDA